MQDEIKDKADMFDQMVEHEEKIRLGEAGWRERYYEVGLGALRPAGLALVMPTSGLRVAALESPPCA